MKSSRFVLTAFLAMASACTIEQTDAPLAPLKQLTLTLTHHGHTTHAVTLRPIAEQ